MSILDSTTPPPTKRKRCEDPLEDESSVDNDILRSSDFWFDDGSIVLQVENTQFRVHRTILAVKSDFFRDMFLLPQPEDHPTVEGCPLVVCMQDSVKDWTNVLKFIYHSTRLEQNGALFQFDFVTSMLRLGKKYQMDVILCAGMAQLEKDIPTQNHRTLYWWTLDPFKDALILFAHINVAQELGIQSILPMCYFLCISTCTTEQLIDGFIAPLHEDGPVLNAATRKLLLMARDGVLPAYRMYMMMWLVTASSDFAKDCQSAGCRKILSKALSQCGERSIYSPTLQPSGRLLKSSLKELCPQCTSNARIKRDEAMDELWEELPSYFNLTKWEDLKDFAD